MAQKILGFHISDELQARISTLLEKVTAAADKRPFAMDLFRIIEEVSDVGLAYFFIQPLKRAKIGGFTIKAVEIAMNLGKSGVLKIGKGVIKGMDNAQLMVVVDLLRQSLTEQVEPKSQTETTENNRPENTKKAEDNTTNDEDDE
jgi:hypothetical protein